MKLLHNFILYSLLLLNIVPYHGINHIIIWIGQGQTKGPDPLVGDEPPRMFSQDMTEEERKELILKAYKQLKSSFQKFVKPDGGKSSPAKTCRDLYTAYPDKLSGQFINRKIMFNTTTIFVSNSF